MTDNEGDRQTMSDQTSRHPVLTGAVLVLLAIALGFGTHAVWLVSTRVLSTEAPQVEGWMTPRHARWTLLALAAVTVLLALPLRHVRLDHDFERFFPINDPELYRYLAHRERFGGDDDYLLIAAEHAPTVFDSSFQAGQPAVFADLPPIQPAMG